MNKLIFFLLCFHLDEVLLANSCEKHTNCNECIRDSSAECVWCPASPSVYRNARCIVKSNSASCPDRVEDPTSPYSVEKNENFSSVNGSVIQIKPQEIHMKLRPGMSEKIDFSYKAVPNYPVDLYFLFDSSQNMQKVRKHIAKHSENIYTTMNGMTNEVWIGLGTFIDKNAIPFSKFITEKSAYSFIHHLNMTSNYTEFETKLNNINPGRNMDDPEGGLDALAQAIICENKIGWRKESRKIIVFLTNAPYHAAGEGRPANIYQPYDGKCYTEDNIYTEELIMDYPSPSMINKLAREKQVKIIFVVESKVKLIYKTLSDSISESKIVEFNQNDDQVNIASTLKTVYEEITKNIKLDVNVLSGRDKINITFDPNCDNANSDSDACIFDLIKVHNFTAFIKVPFYDEDYTKFNITIGVVGIHENVAIQVDVLKDCPCNGNGVPSKLCNGEILQCGECVCSEKRFGNDCACIRNEFNMYNDTSPCKDDDMEYDCNGVGVCNCGQCTCQEGYKGKHCECNANNCLLGPNKLQCSGSDHGECMCDGECKCNPGWSGKTCECDQMDCAVDKHGNDPKICNNRGNCSCGTCTCEKLAIWDKRSESSYCEVLHCSDCHSRTCSLLSECALCKLNEKQNCNCISTKFEEMVDSLNLTIDNWKYCTKVRVDAGCYTTFAYKYDEEEYGVILKLQRDRDCNAIYYAAGAMILLTLLLAGILALAIWKCVTRYQDQQEYERFVKDHGIENERCENPLYLDPVTVIKNPTHHQDSAGEAQTKLKKRF